MRIFNIMMCRDLGGIQQAFLDYNMALEKEGHEIINITSTNAKIHNKVTGTIKLPNLFSWCIISKIYLRIIIAFYKPDIIIAHGGRAITFAKALKPDSIPLVGVSHNYGFKRLKKCDYILVLTNHLKEHMLSHGYEEAKMFQIPNMLNINQAYAKRTFKEPVIIGSFGRFVENKGFIYLIESIALLKRQGYKIKLLLGGSGEEEESLKALVQKLELNHEVIFTSWVHNKKEFFDSIDIFCLPSTNEPFGIILLEAMEHSMPIISSKCGGPLEILRDKVDALMVDIGSSKDIADKLSIFLADPKKASTLAASAYSRLKDKYDINVVGPKLSNILKEIVNK